jgi:hypothetical protein
MSGIGLNKVILPGNAGQDGATSGTKAAESEAVRFCPSIHQMRPKPSVGNLRVVYSLV